MLCIVPEQLKWTRELVNTFWDGVAQTRLDELSFSKTAGEKLLSYIEHHLAPGIRCLDYGAGDGSLVRLLLEYGCKVSALEPSPERRAVIANQPLSTHENFLGFASEQDENSFDLVIAAEVIEHVLDEDLDDTLGAFHRHLKPNGILVVTTPNNEDLDLGACYCPVSGKVFHRWQHVRSFTAESLDVTLSGAGFRRIEDHRVDFSATGELYEQNIELLREIHYLRRLGPLYYLVKRFLDKPRVGDLRLGARTALIYVGQVA